MRLWPGRLGTTTEVRQSQELAQDYGFFVNKQTKYFD